VLHPNEVLDGALVRPYLAMLLETYGIQNNAVVSELYDRHGRELAFAGVVVYVANQLVDERQRAVVMAGNLVRWTLRADAAVFTKSGGGAPNVDMAMIAERCEQLGVRTGMMMWGGAVVEDSALFNAPALDAIVSIGSNSFEFELPPVERVITSRPQEAEAVRSTITLPPTRLVGVIDHFGSSRLAGVVY
jgi:glycine reductase complex component B subunit alpha and beta